MFVGQAVPALDSWAKVTASHLFLGDHRFDGDLWAGIVRSPHAHARLVDISVAGSPSLVATYTARDVPSCRFNPALAPDSEQLSLDPPT